MLPHDTKPHGKSVFGKIIGGSLGGGRANDHQQWFAYTKKSQVRSLDIHKLRILQGIVLLRSCAARQLKISDGKC